MIRLGLLDNLPVVAIRRSIEPHHHLVHGKELVLNQVGDACQLRVADRAARRRQKEGEFQQHLFNGSMNQLWGRLRPASAPEVGFGIRPVFEKEPVAPVQAVREQGCSVAQAPQGDCFGKSRFQRQEVPHGHVESGLQQGCVVPLQRNWVKARVSN